MFWYRGTRDGFFIAAALNIGRKRGGAKGSGIFAPFFDNDQELE